MFQHQLASARLNKVDGLNKDQLLQGLPPVHTIESVGRSVQITYSFAQFPALFEYLHQVGLPTPQLSPSAAMRVRGLALFIDPSLDCQLSAPLALSTVRAIEPPLFALLECFVEEDSPLPSRPLRALLEGFVEGSPDTFALISAAAPAAPAALAPAPAPAALAPAVQPPSAPPAVQPPAEEVIASAGDEEDAAGDEEDAAGDEGRNFHDEAARCDQQYLKLLDSPAASILKAHVPSLSHEQELFTWQVIYALMFYKPADPSCKRGHSTSLPPLAELLPKTTFPQLGMSPSHPYFPQIAGEIGLARRRPSPDLPLLSPASSKQDFLDAFEQLLSYISPRLPEMWDNPAELIPFISYLFQMLAFFNDAVLVPVSNIRVPNFFLTMMSRLITPTRDELR